MANDACSEIFSTRTDFMSRALSLSRRALPDCLPNPPVGCVLVSQGEILAEGYTRFPGHHHAEVEALSKLPDGAGSVEAYVTLEPCSFRGRTPSCAQALIDRGVQRVYVALIDPHPLNQGRGIEMMRSAGLEVFTGIEKEAVAGFIGSYLNIDPLYQQYRL
ncbi:bifunctional diaminohydroxyphosphoribosylaminopyrimidine deaminase/5-amino-6-(5-phosphoribosylamino)uracil reductase RibD [Kushneria aurantia]|uniref:Bifunctional diaminohydroxyphosphoribosylaminopyrimidine deaminase/5-amino-6-(5-phosphoribosylamino)uracil reductase RibD n=1 Tax=Kushneria aurantia TaxID=504092 RepID=A0ABV6G980_9GAMM|nr:bifunctional diaminohydroxyphosphoribosylaminopyrimidine deaminase/5-amino-6-(5-phosphoribosylamino)uracil reductase RibD [Kushneria aurantia]